MASTLPYTAIRRRTWSGAASAVRLPTKTRWASGSGSGSGLGSGCEGQDRRWASVLKNERMACTEAWGTAAVGDVVGRRCRAQRWASGHKVLLGPQRFGGGGLKGRPGVLQPTAKILVETP